MALKALLKLHLPKKGLQQCCCCQTKVDKNDLELWICQETVLRENKEKTEGYWQKTGSQELHTLCGECVRQLDPDMCKPVNRILGVDDEEEPPSVKQDQLA